jgi:hypothetical protein
MEATEHKVNNIKVLSEGATQFRAPGHGQSIFTVAGRRKKSYHPLRKNTSHVVTSD